MGIDKMEADEMGVDEIVDKMGSVVLQHDSLKFF